VGYSIQNQRASLAAPARKFREMEEEYIMYVFVHVLALNFTVF
jgi:hypothetical protein